MNDLIITDSNMNVLLYYNGFRYKLDRIGTLYKLSCQTWSWEPVDNDQEQTSVVEYIRGVWNLDSWSHKGASDEKS